jgi:hypothetical protein
MQFQPACLIIEWDNLLTTIFSGDAMSAELSIMVKNWLEEYY